MASADKPTANRQLLQNAVKAAKAAAAARKEAEAKAKESQEWKDDQSQQATIPLSMKWHTDDPKSNFPESGMASDNQVSSFEAAEPQATEPQATEPQATEHQVADQGHNLQESSSESSEKNNVSSGYKNASEDLVYNQEKVQVDDSCLKQDVAYHPDMKLVPTSGDGNLCGLEAIHLSFKHQHPTLRAPTVAQLQMIAQMLDLEDESNFSDTQLDTILQAWAAIQKISIGLCIHLSESTVFVFKGKPDQMRLHIHNDMAPQLIAAVDTELAKQVLGHWSGMAPGTDTTSTDASDADAAVSIHPVPEKPSSHAVHPPEGPSTNVMPQTSTGDSCDDPSDKAPAALRDIADIIQARKKKKKVLREVNNIMEQPRTEPDALMNHILREVFNRVVREKEETLEAFKKRKIKQAGISESCYMNAVLFQNLGIPHLATYFHPETGERLVDTTKGLGIRERFFMKYDCHMPNFSAWISLKKSPKATPDNVAEEAYDSEDDEFVQNPDTCRKDIRFSQHAYNTKAQSFINTCRVSINFESLKNITYIDMTQTGNSEEDDALIDLLPRPIVEHAAKSITGVEDHPIFVRMEFDVRSAAKVRTHVGTAKWAEPWAEQVKTGSLTMIIDGDSTAVRRLEVMEMLMDTHKQFGSPLNQWFTEPGTRRVYDSKSVDVSIVKTGDFRYPFHLSFYSTEEYLTVATVSNRYKYQAIQADARAWDDHACKLRLGRMSEYEDRAYLGWIDLPPNVEKSSERPQAGAILGITFRSQWTIEPTQTARPEVWIAHVIEASPGPPDMIPVTINRPWYRQENKFSTEKVHVIDTATADPDNLALVIEKDRGNLVHISVRPQLKIIESQLNAIEDLNYKAKSRPDFTQFNEDIKVALVGSNIHELKNRDIFANVREEFDDVTRVMDLNQLQREAVVAMKSAPAGIALVQGPAGTGKSWLGIEVAVPFFMSTKSHQLLFVASTNIAVDSMARKLEARIDKLREQQKLKHELYIIRAYTPSADRSIREIEMDTYGKGKKPNKRPQSIQGAKPDVMDKVMEIFSQYYTEANATIHTGKYAPIGDKRVLSPELSLATKMLEVIGWCEGKHTYPNEDRFSRLRGNMTRYVNNKLESEKEFGSQLKDALDFTLSNAAAVVATTEYAGLSRVISVLEERCCLVIADGCSRESEDRLMPLFSSRMPLSGFVMLGDIWQLPPTVILGEDQNVYYKQDAVSFMSRMISLGFAYSELVVQHRMNEILCDMANVLTYDNKLQTHESVFRQKQLKSIQFGSWVRDFIGRRESYLFFDQASKDVGMLEYRGTSRFQELYVVQAISMAKELLQLHKQATVAMLTAYAAQRDRLAQAAANLFHADPDLVTGPDGFRLFASTIDGAQGEEYDYVIHTILTDQVSGLGFQKDPQRGNVATTRARHGYVLIASHQDIGKSHIQQRNFVGRHLNYVSRAHKLTRFTTMPSSIYYRPTVTRRDTAVAAARYYSEKA